MSRRMSLMHTEARLLTRRPAWPTSCSSRLHTPRRPAFPPCPTRRRLLCRYRYFNPPTLPHRPSHIFCAKHATACCSLHALLAAHGSPSPLPGSASTFGTAQGPPPDSSASVSHGRSTAPPTSPLKQLILPGLRSSNAHPTSNAYRPRSKSRGTPCRPRRVRVSARAHRVSPSSRVRKGDARSRPGSAGSIQSAERCRFP